MPAETGERRHLVSPGLMRLISQIERRDKSLKSKEETIVSLKEYIGKSKAAFFTEFRGLNVSSVTELRNDLRKSSAEYKVVKNTLMRIASKGSLFEKACEHLEGPTAVAFAYGDPVEPAKALLKFLKSAPNLKIKSGLLEGKELSFDEVKELSELPSRDVLLRKMLGSMNSPLYGLVNVLAGVPRSLLNVLEAIKKQKEN